MSKMSGEVSSPRCLPKLCLASLLKLYESNPMNHFLRLSAAALLCCFTLGCTPPATDDDVTMDTVDAVEETTSNTTMGMETPDSNTTTGIELPTGETP